MCFYPSRALWSGLFIVFTGLPGAAIGQDADNAGTKSSAGNQLAPITVTATRSRSIAYKTPRRVTIISHEQIQQQLAISSDRGKVLSTLIPSYSPSRSKLTDSGETVRGRKPLFLVDGVPQSNPLRDASRDSYTIDLSAIDHIEVLSGASAEQGLGATGAIINFVTKRAKPGNVNQHIGAQLTTGDDFEDDGFGHKFDYQISGATDHWDYLANISQQNRGSFYDGDDERVGFANQGEIQDSSSYNAFLKLGYAINDNQRVEAWFNRFELNDTDDRVPVPGDRDAGVPTTARPGDLIGKPAYNHVTQGRLSYTNDDLLGNELNAFVYTERFRGQYIGGPYFPYFPYPGPNGDTKYDQTRNESNKIGAKITFNRRGMFNDYLDLTAGIDLLQDKTQQDLVQTGRTYVPETTFRNYAPFLQGTVHVTDWFDLHGGVRYEIANLQVDDFSTIDRSNVLKDNIAVKGGNPSFHKALYNVGLIYQATDWLQFYGDYSQGYSVPDVGRVLRDFPDTNRSVEDLVQLKPVVTDNYEAGTRFDWNRYSFELSYFKSKSDLGQRFEPDSRGLYRAKREKTEIEGVELTGKVRVTDDQKLDLSYAHTEGKSDQNGDGKVDTKLSGINIAPDTLRVGWGSTWTPKLSTRLQAVHYFDRSVDNPKKDFNGYTLVDASLAYRLPVGQASLGIQNLLDKSYFDYYSQSARVDDKYYFRGRGRVFTVRYQVDF